MNDFSLSFSDLSVGYGKTPVLRGLFGAARQGNFTVLIGPNGSGKSTLLRALAGLLPCEGSLRVGCRDLKRLLRREPGRIVGVVPQHARTAAPFTVYEVVALGRLPWQGLTGRLSEEDCHRVLRAAECAGVAHLLSRPATRLSGGEAQRVALAVVLAQDPPIMLMDEPGSAQDPLQTLRVFSLLKRLAGEGRTVVAAVHDVNSVLPFADAFLALKEGRFASGGAITDLDARVLSNLYETPFEAFESTGGRRAWHASAKLSERF